MYSIKQHTDDYIQILKEWLITQKFPKDIANALRFYEPDSHNKLRLLYIKREDDFTKLADCVLQIEFQSSDRYQVGLFNELRVTKSCIHTKSAIFDETVQHSNRILTPFTCLDRKFNYPFRSYDCFTNTAIIDKVEQEVYKDTPYFLFNSRGGTSNLGHFVHDTLIQVGIFDEIKKDVSDLCPVVLGHFRYPIMKLLFEKLVSPKYLVLKHSGGHILHNVYVPPRIGYWFEQTKESCFALVKKLKDKINTEILNKLPNTFVPYENRFYISRQDGTANAQQRLSRHYSNIEEIEKLLQSYGFVQLTLSEVSPLQIVEMLASSSAILGAHGAGLMNYIFAPKNCRVIELGLYPKTPVSIQKFAKLYGVDFHSIPANSDSSTKKQYIDLKLLEKELKEI